MTSDIVLFILHNVELDGPHGGQPQEAVHVAHTRRGVRVAVTGRVRRLGKGYGDMAVEQPQQGGTKVVVVEACMFRPHRGGGGDEGPGSFAEEGLCVDRSSSTWRDPFDSWKQRGGRRSHLSPFLVFLLCNDNNDTF